MKPQETSRSLLVARCGTLRIGVPVDRVDRVVAAPLPDALPGAPAAVVGLLNYHGAPMVVLDPARRGAEVRDAITLDHRIMLVSSSHGLRGLLCESVDGLMAVDAEVWSGLETLVPGAGYLAAGTVDGEQLVVLYDLDRSLSVEDEGALQAALARRQESVS